VIAWLMGAGVGFVFVYMIWALVRAYQGKP